jgi:hypothetical protein
MSDVNTEDNRRFVCVLDGEDGIVEVNDDWTQFAVENQYGLDKHEVIDHCIWDFIVDGYSRELYQDLFAKVRQEQCSLTIEFRCDCAELKRFMAMKISPLPDRGIDLTSWVLKLEPQLRVDLFDVTAERSSKVLKVCDWCKQVETESQHWISAEDYMSGLDTTQLLPSLVHSICPGCYQQAVEKFNI